MAAENTATTQQVPTEHKLLGETYGFWAQTGVLAVAAVFAYMAIRSSRAIERRKAASEAIFSGRRDTQLIEAVRKIAVLHDGTTKIAEYGKKDRVDSDEAKTIRYALNHYEYVSVAISRGIFDEEIFKRSSYSTILKLYEHTKTFIEQVRKENGTTTTWQEFECLVIRWQGRPLKKRTIMSIENTGRIKQWFGR